MTRLRGIPQPGTSNFSRTLILPDIFNRPNFEYRVFSGLKADSLEKKKEEKIAEKKQKKKQYASWGKRT